ncbi:Dentin sialophosphoprotein-related, putative isoform 2 [Hibiscus syriacus]|uniref:Dentin sialophosphoprotein-related, putative isoform 2 n=1 Tax=Hibiscus syriacus TaxID=106335 RepID=A0A6A2WMC9_HIBSY|nr:Dentin sialophosphoprotein-related, putative isoform 2 [Hibiscus syriacus]
MSDLCMYELEDNVWDDFGDTDDHIVPHTADEYGAQLKVQGNSKKRPRLEVIGATGDTDNTNKYGILGEKKKGVNTLIKNKMLEKEPRSHSPDRVFTTSAGNDSHKEIATMGSDDPRMSSHDLETGKIDSVGCDFCSDDSLLVDKCATEDYNDYCFPLNHITAADDDLRFFNNNLEDKENGDLLYFGLGEMGNFEDVDRMFRSCDSTFGLGSFGNEDDLCWFSSSQLAEGSQDALKANAKLNSIQEECSTSGPASAGDNAGLVHASSLHIANKESESKDDLTSCEQISPQEKHSKQHMASGGRKDQYLENGGSFTQYGSIKQFADVKHPITNSSCQLFSSSDLQRNKQKFGPDSVNYIETDIPYMLPSYINSSDQVSICPTISSVKSENHGHSSSKIELFHTSNQVQCMESSNGPSFEAPSIITSEKRGKLYCQQDTQIPLDRNAKHAKMGSELAICDPINILNQVQQDECRSEVEGVSVVNPAGLDSSNARESSCIISPLDEVSLEATSFCQLQQVMEKLDIRTKLCIRDSLYRLARSAEQRHNCSKPKGGIRDDKDEDASGSSVVHETSKCTGFIDMETDTNPIDRSIAHLLFHRPSDPSQRPVIDAASLKSRGTTHGSITNPLPMLSEKQVGSDETDDAGSDKKVPTNCDCM